MPKRAPARHYVICALSGKRTLNPAYCNAPCRDMHSQDRTIYPTGTPFRHAAHLTLLPHDHPWLSQADRLNYTHEHDFPIFQIWLDEISKCGGGRDDEWRWLVQQAQDPIHWCNKDRIVTLRNTVLQIWCERKEHSLNEAMRNLFA